MKSKSLIIVGAFALASTAAYADPAEIRDAFWTGYYGASNSFQNSFNNSARQTEALINEMRAARGAPPCAFGFLRQLILDRPSC